MNFLYRPSTGKVVSYSSSAFEDVPEELAEITISLTSDQISKIEKNYEAYIRNGDLDIIQPENYAKEEEKEALKAKMQQGTITLQDLYNFIIN